MSQFVWLFSVIHGYSPQSGVSLVLSVGARRRRSRSFDLFKEPPRPVSRERSSAQAVRDGGGALHEGRDRGRRGLRGRRQHHRGGRASTSRRRQDRGLDPTSSRAVAEYLSVLDDAAFGGATAVEPKVISPTDPAGPLHCFGQLCRRLCLFRQLPHRSEACGDHGR